MNIATLSKSLVLFSVIFFIPIFSSPIYSPFNSAAYANEIAQISLTGQFELMTAEHSINEDPTRNYILVTSDGTINKLKFDDRLVSTPLDSQVNLIGKWENDLFAITSITLIKAPPISSNLTTKKMAYILFNFRNNQSRPFTTNDIKNLMYHDTDSTNNYFIENSFNSLKLTGARQTDGDVFDWVTIPYENSNCDTDYYQWSISARTILEQQGEDFSKYTNFIYFMPSTPGCIATGWGLVGGHEMWTNDNSLIEIKGIIPHEFGHNLGFFHANSYECYTTPQHIIRVAISQYCSSITYGDPFDVMGRDLRSRHHLSNYHKGRLGWLYDSNTLTVPVPPGSTSVTHNLYPIETRNDTVMSIRIPRVITNGVQKYFYLEYRRPYGFDNFLESNPVVNGVSIRIAPDYSLPALPLLIDTHPETNTFDDAPLRVGETFIDPVSQVVIRTVAANSSYITINISRMKNELK